MKRKAFLVYYTNRGYGVKRIEKSTPVLTKTGVEIARENCM